MATRISTLAQG